MRSSPTIINCTISNNASTNSGGGIGCYWNSSPIITNCIISFNKTGYWGGGLNCYESSSPIVTNCIIAGNAANSGGGIRCHCSCPIIANCTFSGNAADSRGGGIFNDNSSPILTNCILWGDTPEEINGGTSVITYCDVQDGWPGEGNINANPLFVDAANADYHLQAGSPCVDTGDNSVIGQSLVVDLEQNPRIENGIVDMGAYEFGIAAPPPTLSEALDTDLSLTTSGDADWIGQTTTSYYGKDAAQSGDISHNHETWMQTIVKGAGTVSFYWKVSSEEDFDFLEFYIDGSLHDQISGSVDWQQMTYTINALGSHTLGWRYLKDKGTDSGSDCGWIDKLEWVPAPPPILTEALDTDLSFTTGGKADWFYQSTTSQYGGDAAQSGDISQEQESWLQTTVSGAGTVSFYWKVSSEEYFDFLEFYIDGSLQDRISGSVDWQQMTYTITGSGLHTLEWQYIKDVGTDSGSDCGWIDKIEWVTN
jgi:hypothetical protein